MSYITYGPSPISHYRVAATPADSVFTSPLDRPDRLAPLRHRVVSASRKALSIAATIAIVLAAAAAALALRFAVYAMGHAGGFF